MKKEHLIFLVIVSLFLMNIMPVCAKPVFRETAVFDVPEANQAVAVDEKYFYAIDNQTIGKYDKITGKQVATWKGSKDGPIIHLDSGVVVDGKLYCAHSNYPDSPMVSSVEIWDTQSLKHIATHSFGIHWGSLTWIDRHEGYWWVLFANYNKVFGASNTPYGNVYNTTLVKFDDNWQWQEAWTLPAKLLPKFEIMSCSGGSWGPDGQLYLSGHDPAEVYVMKLPEAGSVLEWLDTIPLDIRGQGIAWDHSAPGSIYGIIRAKRQVTVSVLTDDK
ncbi:MAG: cycloisomerase [Negativicutes bacterium]|nr:cycloisomerase [Negativicutes bacterium]